MRPRIARAATLLLAATATCTAYAATPHGIEPQPDFEPTLCNIPVHRVEMVDFMGFFADRADAAAAANHFDPERFAVTIRRAELSAEWVLRAVYRSLPTPEAFAADTRRLMPARAAAGGKSNGHACSYRTPFAPVQKATTAPGPSPSARAGADAGP